VMALAFFIAMIFLQASITNHSAQQITETMEIVRQSYG
jgi:hypothetical protein